MMRYLRLNSNLLKLPTFLVSVLLVSFACSKKEDPPERKTTSKSLQEENLIEDGTDENVFNIETGALKTSEVMKFLKEKCSACHGQDENGKKGTHFSSWPMPDDSLTLRNFEVSIFAPMVYAALVNKLATKPSQSPQAMPPSDLDDDEIISVRGILAWFTINLPFVVAEAEQTFGLVSDENRDANIIKFRCTNPVTGRKLINRLTNALFDRQPLPAEIALFDEDELNEPVSKSIRKKIVANLRKDAWKNEFISSGLRKLADSIGGAPAILYGQTFDPDETKNRKIVDEIKLEFYLLLREYYDKFEYKEFFTTNNVMVSDLTAKYYAGCEDKSKPNAYVACEAGSSRDGFFTTLGFLNSKPSSFLRENNNYGRMAMMYFTLMGQTFTAAFDEDAGGDVRPLPDCLGTEDLRHKGGAPRGAAAIPAFGNLCQSCHISRNMAAGSVLFRKYSMNGEIYTPSNLSLLEPIDYAEAIGTDEVPTDWTNLANVDDDLDGGDALTAKMLEDLLTMEPKTCVVPANKNLDPIAVKTPGDIAGYLLENERALVRGFIRHAHRTFSRSQEVNFDLVYTAIQSYEDGNKKLPDLLESYFLSETFACDEAGKDAN